MSLVAARCGSTLDDHQGQQHEARGNEPERGRPEWRNLPENHLDRRRVCAGEHDEDDERNQDATRRQDPPPYAWVLQSAESSLTAAASLRDMTETVWNGDRQLMLG